MPMVFLSRRAARMAASLSTLARSAPEKPGVCLASTSSATTRFERLAARVHVQDRLAAANVRRGHDDDAVEAARPQQRRIEHVRTIGRGDDDHARVIVEAIHLDQDLVQRLLALVVGVAQASSALPTDRVDLVDKDDARRALAWPLSNRSRTRLAPTPTNISTNSDPEMLKNGTPASPATARASSVLPVPGGPTSSTPCGMRAPSAANFWRLAQELDDFLKLQPRLVDTGDIGKRDRVGAWGDDSGATAPEGHQGIARRRERDAQRRQKNSRMAANNTIGSTIGSSSSHAGGGGATPYVTRASSSGDTPNRANTFSSAVSPV